MGIEPTWDSPHCPTPDLKSGSPTSELGTSGPIYNRIGSLCRGFWHGAWSMEKYSWQLAAGSRQPFFNSTRYKVSRCQVSGVREEKQKG